MSIQKELKSIRKYLPIIKRSSEKYNIDENILLGIAILENINRPFWFRFLERFMPYSLFEFKTFGLMQISSKCLITDQESIELAAQYIVNLNHKNDPILAGLLYNGSYEYGKCLNYIISEIIDEEASCHSRVRGNPEGKNSSLLFNNLII